MSAWDGLAQVTEEFSLKGVVSHPMLRERFGVFADYVDALIRVTGELGKDLGEGRRETVGKDVERLEEVAQIMAESLLLTVAGMYSASAIVYRGAIESIFQYLADEVEQVDERMVTIPQDGRRERPWPFPEDRNPTPGRINAWLEYYRTEHWVLGQKLGKVYSRLSAVAHRDHGTMGHLAGYLRSLPRRELLDQPGSEAANRQREQIDWLQNQIERGCVLGTLVIKARFAPHWRNIFDGTQADLNRAVETMAARRDLTALLEAERAGRS